MYSGLPKGHRRVVVATLASAWLLSTGAGLSAVLDPRVSVAALGYLGTAISGIALAGATLVAAAGVIFGRYRWEWIAGWVGVVALVPYVVTLWAITLAVSGSNAGQTFLVSSLAAFYASRIALCSAHAAKLREVHVATTAVIDSITEGESDAGDSRSGGV